LFRFSKLGFTKSFIEFENNIFLNSFGSEIGIKSAYFSVVLVRNELFYEDHPSIILIFLYFGKVVKRPVS